MNMSQPEAYEDIVLGSGAGGKLLSWHLARSGRRVAVVERRYIGGAPPHTNHPPPTKKGRGGPGAPGPRTKLVLWGLARLPPHLVVLGGGYVGLEFAQAYRRFGSRVTVVQHGPQLLGREDTNVAEELRRVLQAEGID